MNTQSNTGEPVEAQKVPPAVMSATRPFYWSLRRELWENRFVYFGPLAVAAVFLFGFLISIPHLPGKLRALGTLNPMQQHDAITSPYDFAEGLLMVTGMFVGAFYCLDALYGERRDRSILFWKSLPVSDTTAVLAKACIPLVILPPLLVVISFVLQLLMLLASSAVLAASGLSASAPWAQAPPIQNALLLLYHLVTVHALMHAPFYAWLLLVSAWSRRMPLLWAALPPLAIVGLERHAFHTMHFVKMIGNQLSGSGLEAITAPDTLPTNPMTHLTPGTLLGSPDPWIGLAVTAVFLFGAIQLRRYRGPF